MTQRKSKSGKVFITVRRKSKHKKTPAVLTILLCCAAVYGCIVADFVKPDKPPYYRQFLDTYNQTNLRQSSSADVLAVIYTPEYELLSQSKSVIASAGQDKKTYRNWFNMVAFDEDELTARRKYLVVIDERAEVLFGGPREGATFDAQLVLDEVLLNQPYATENARRIAILKSVAQSLRNDVSQVAGDNKMLEISAMVVNQSLQAVVTKLDASPAFAAELSEAEGLDFASVSFDKGKIQMLIDGDVATVEMMLGTFVRFFENRQEVLRYEQNLRSPALKKYISKPTVEE